MNYRTLYGLGQEVCKLSFGGNILGGKFDREQSFALLDAYHEQGGNFIDTADMYSVWMPGHRGGESEEVIGAWMKDRGVSDAIVVGTKVGLPMSADEKGLSASYILSSAERSLRRLGRDHIDIYYAHTDDFDTPIEETLKAFDSLVSSGKVRSLGVSKHTAARLSASLDISEKENLARYVVVQPNYNLYTRNIFEGELRDVCLARSVDVVPHSALATGFLSGKYRSRTEVEGRKIAEFFDERGVRLLDVLHGVADETGHSPAQIAIAWLLEREGVKSVVASPVDVPAVAELMAAVGITLAPEHYTALSEI